MATIRFSFEDKTIDEKVVEQDQLIMPGMFASKSAEDRPEFSRLSKGDRRLRVFSANAGFEILPSIDRVSDYCVEPNIFFAPRYCVPAMPRIDDRQVRLMVLQDNDDRHSETRFLMPFTVEKPGFAVGPSGDHRLTDWQVTGAACRLPPANLV